MRTQFKLMSFVALGVCLGLIIWFGFFNRVKSAAQEKSKRPILTKLPPIKNCTEHIKLLKAELLTDGDAQVARLEVENDAYIGVISISIDQIADKGKHSVILSAFSPDKAPLIVIKPGETKSIWLENLSERSPIRIGGVMFSDGTEEGCESSLKEIRALKDHDMKKGHPK